MCSGILPRSIDNSVKLNAALRSRRAIEEESMRIRSLDLVIVMFLILAGFQTASAQGMWARSYGGGSYELIWEGHSTSDGGAVAIGTTASFGSGGYDMWITKVDSSGNLQWQKAIGGAEIDEGHSIQQTSDGGYIGAGIVTVAGDEEIGVVRLDPAGNIQWQKTFGGSNQDYGWSVRQTSDGGFIVAGHSLSFGMAGLEVLVIKLNSFGNLQWEKTYGGVSNDFVEEIQQTSDGGYVFAGGIGQPSDLWVVRVDSSGNLIWQRSFHPGAGNGAARAIQQTTDGGFIVVGSTGNGSTSDMVVLKLNSSGSVQWQNSYSGPAFDSGYSVLQLPTGEYMIAGSTTSFGAGSEDAWLLKLDANGNVLVQKAYGATNSDYVGSVDMTSDGGFLFAGSIETGSPVSSEFWLLKVDSNAEISPDCPLATDSFAAVSPSALIAATPAVTVNSVTVTMADSTFSAADTVAVVAEQCSGLTCLYCDDFEDGVLASDWSYLKPAWSESGGSLVATPVKKGVAIASPVFGGCSDCSFETDLTIAGGQGNRVWILAWYADKGNTLEVLLKEESDKIIVKQRLNGTLVAKAKGAVPIDSNVNYNIRIVKDATQFSVLVDGNSVITMPVSGAPFGTIGLEAKNTTCQFGHVSAE